MEDVSYHEFCKTIANDYKIEFMQKIKTKFNQFLVKDGKRKISSQNDAIIVDNQGNEHPYMLSQHVRNNDKLVEFDYIYIVRGKHLTQIIDETGVKLGSKNCKICEGGGWYTKGTRYSYKNIYCEV